MKSLAVAFAIIAAYMLVGKLDYAAAQVTQQIKAAPIRSRCPPRQWIFGPYLRNSLWTQADPKHVTRLVCHYGRVLT